MTTIRLEGKAEKARGIYYEYDPYSPPLGIGGMGKVFKGRQISNTTNAVTEVAIKFMFEDLPMSVIERARREASLQIDNENLLKMMGFVQTEEKTVLGEIKYRYHVVSELLEGIVLSDLLENKIDQQASNQVFARKLYSEYKNAPYQFAITVIKSILSGVMALHDRGYIHRDIDPSNIMLTQDGKIKLIDFGIAKQLNNLNTTDKTLTSAGVFIGKSSYAAPELVLGDLNHQGRSTDIYAVGILLFQLITGHLPFDGPIQVVLNAQLHRNLPLSEIKQSRLRGIIKKATSKNQNDRYQTAAEFRVAIEQIEQISYPDRFELFPVYLTGPKKRALISVTVSVATLLGVALFLNWQASNNPDKNKAFVTDSKNVEKIEQSNPLDSEYSQAVQLLMNKETAQEGFTKITTLSNQNYSEAIYLLGRLYYDGKSLPDSIKNMQTNLAGSCIPDNSLSHQLNLKAIEADSCNYKALYELGTDYFGGKARTNLDMRNLDSACYYLEKGLKLAKEKNDTFYLSKIQNQLQKIKGVQ